jgi:hypothetical protein
MARTWPGAEARVVQQLRHDPGVKTHQRIGGQRGPMDLVTTRCVQVQQGGAQVRIEGPVQVGRGAQGLVWFSSDQNAVHAIQRGARHQPDEPGHGQLGLFETGAPA